MKKMMDVLKFGILISIIISAGLASAGDMTLSSESQLSLEGDSTMHVYHSYAKEMKSELHYKDSNVAMTSEHIEKMVKDKEMTSLTLDIAVKQLKSDKSGLDKNLYDALGADKFASISFKMITYEITGQTIKVHGHLIVHGVDAEEDITGDINFDGGQLHVKGQKDLLMTHFGVKPPRMLFGAIKTDDKITIHYDLIWTPVESKSVTDEKNVKIETKVEKTTK